MHPMKERHLTQEHVRAKARDHAYSPLTAEVHGSFVDRAAACAPVKPYSSDSRFRAVLGHLQTFIRWRHDQGAFHRRLDVLQFGERARAFNFGQSGVHWYHVVSPPAQLTK